MNFDKLVLKDPSGNEVTIDAQSFGLAIALGEMRSHVAEQMKKSIQNPMMVVEGSNGERLYCLGYKVPQLHFFISHVINKEEKWYVDYYTLEYDENIMHRMIQEDKKVF
ncbi:hypothetical protein [Foetidibacter luteolus]|uniref:hypothetical protein n=1 Tax=Foetidibacter luteolus TaxID=2608880 RepID=UPI00129BED23|nr:hypothetical protein [Foetidibacter luteolus]